jgi:hypothetical protein
MTTRGLRRKLGDVVRLIDSTGLHLAGTGTNWARFPPMSAAPRRMWSMILTLAVRSIT